MVAAGWSVRAASRADLGTGATFGLEGCVGIVTTQRPALPAWAATGVSPDVDLAAARRAS